MQATPFTATRSATTGSQAWRLQDAKSQFSALVDNAIRGVPQHVTRRGKQAVVVLSEQHFEALQRAASHRVIPPANFIEHLLAMPTEPSGASRKALLKASVEPSVDASMSAPVKASMTGSIKTAGTAASKPPVRKAAGATRLAVQPREIDWS